MSDTTRHHAPDERAPNVLTVLLAHSTNVASKDTPSKALVVTNVTTPPNPQPTTYTEPTQPLAQNSPHTLFIPRIIEALAMGPATLKSIITSLPTNWREVNNKGTPITKHTLLQCIWGNHTETDGLHNLQQAIITAYPRTHTNVT